ncbi:MAG: kelch repeat-containing protein [Terriglobales bacterium]
MTSLSARLLTLAAFASLSSSAPASSDGASISEKAQRQLPSAVAGACALLVLGAVCVPVHAQFQLNWLQDSPGYSPLARVSSTMAYDAAQGNVVLFGGDNGAVGDLNDTWVWDGTNWTQASPAANPPARASHGMAYDAAQGNVVLFGGYSGGYLLNDTWVWDGANWTQAGPAASPPARCCFAMAYDAAHGNVVLFGGYNPFVGGPDLNDTWVWDGANWTQASPAVSPPARCCLAMAYDAAHGNVVLFGGSATGSPVNDTWVWDGANWAQLSPGTSPPARYAFAMAYDTAQGNVVLFGGDSGGVNAELLSDTWVWDGDTWTQESPATSPPARINHAMACDAAQGNVVLFGGTDYRFSFLNDTWVWEIPHVTASPASLNFGNKDMGGSHTQQVVLYNPGPSKVMIGTASITPTGGDSTAFSFHQYCGQTLKAGRTCIIGVTFTPHAASLDTATLNIPTNTPSSPLEVPLSGTGTNKK